MRLKDLFIGGGVAHLVDGHLHLLRGLSHSIIVRKVVPWVTMSRHFCLSSSLNTDVRLSLSVECPPEAGIDHVKIMIFTSTCDTIATSPCAIVPLLLSNVSFQNNSAIEEARVFTLK